MFEWIDRLLHPEFYIQYDLWVEHYRAEHRRLAHEMVVLKRKLKEFEALTDEISNQDGSSA